MSGALHLVITTTMDVVVDDAAVTSLRAQDESGGFGILPGHTDFLTVLPASIIRWRSPGKPEQFAGVRAGLLSVTGGREIAIACRDAILGEDIHALEERIAAFRRDQDDAGRHERVEQMRLHANAVREMIRLLRPGQGDVLPHPSGFGVEQGEQR